MVTPIVTSVTAALLIAAIFGWLKSRRLFVIAPKMYLTTTLSDGQIVSITLLNSGFLPEEDVALTIRSSCKFELLGTSKSTLATKGNTLSLPKLGRNESVAILLLVEDSKFSDADIESIESKSTKGKVVESKEKASSVGQTCGAWAIIAVLFGLPFVFGTIVGSETGTSAIGYVRNSFQMMGDSKQLAGYKIESRERYGIGALDGAFKRGKITTEIREIVRRGDILYVDYAITNNTDDILLATVRLDGMAGRGTLDYQEGRLEDLGMLPKQTKSGLIKVYKPESHEIQLIKIDVGFSNSRVDHMNLEQVLTLK